MDKIFQISKNQLFGVINTLVVEKNIEGFIFSFFNHYDIVIENSKHIGKLNPSIKKDIVFVNNKDFYPFYRDSKLFNEIDNEIILTHEEIEFINSGYFETKVNILYEQIENETLKFYLENKTTYKQNVIETFIELEKKINDNNYYNPNYSGRISNFNKLKISSFRNYLNSKLSNYKILIKDFIEDQNIKNQKKNNEKLKDIKENMWFRVGVKFANGEIYELNKQKLSFRKISEILFDNPKYSNYISTSFSDSVDSDKNIFRNIEKMNAIYNYCQENNIKIHEYFIKKYQKLFSNEINT